MCPLFLKLSSVLKLLILTAKLLVNIKTQNFYSCLILTENFVVSIESFQTFRINNRDSSNIKTFNLNKLCSYFQQHDLHERTKIILIAQIEEYMLMFEIN